MSSRRPNAIARQSQRLGSAVSGPDRTLGWIMSLSGGLLLIGRTPTILAQSALFAPWWTALGSMFLVLVLVMAVGGKQLPGVVLRVCWVAIPVLGVVLSSTWALAYTDGPLAADSNFDPWIRGMEAGLIAYPLLVFRIEAALIFGIGYPFVAVISPLVFWGSAPRPLIADIPIHVGMVAFVVIFAGIRARLTVIDAEEHNVRRQRERELHAEHLQERQEELGRLVHDEVLSVLVGAMQVTGAPSAELRKEAMSAQRAMEEAEQSARSSDVVSAQQGLEEIAAAVADFEGVSLRVDGPAEDALDVPRPVVRALLMAAREAVRNAMKHAGDGPIVVDVRHKSDAWLVTINDSGPGFDVGLIPVDRLGVRESLHGRMWAVGGEARIVSRRSVIELDGATSDPVTGTTVELSWRG